MSLDISLIISIYDRIDFLDLVLKSVLNQHESGFEIIIAEDGESPKVKDFISKFEREHKIDLIHVSHPDKGFQKCTILNKAIQQSSGNFIIFIDGDCILHKNFVKAYRMFREKGVCLTGRRVELREKTTEKLLQSSNLKRLSILRLLIEKNKCIEEAIYLGKYNFRKCRSLIGCNFGLYKADLLKINGFDEDYDKATFGEDTDVEWRLISQGINIKSLKNVAIQYHLHHPKANRTDDSNFNKTKFLKKKEEGLAFCKNGITKLT